MTMFGAEEIDLKDDNDLTIRPNNAAELGFAVPENPAPLVDADLEDSLFAELANEAAAEIDHDVFFPVDSRPGWVLGFSATINQKELTRYRKAATNNGRKKAEDADLVIGNAMPLIEKNIGIYKIDAEGRRVQVIDPKTDRPLKIGSPTFVAMQGKGLNEVGALTRFMGGESKVSALGAALLKASGWGEDYAPLDPTEG